MIDKAHTNPIYSIHTEHPQHQVGDRPFSRDFVWIRLVLVTVRNVATGKTTTKVIALANHKIKDTDNTVSQSKLEVITS